METLAGLIKDISAEERAEMLKILNIELAIAKEFTLKRNRQPPGE